MMRRKNQTHGMSDTPEYRSFASAKTRCRNPNHNRYSTHGGRGIEMRFNSFKDFYTEVGDRPEPKGLYSLDRYPNNDGHYEPGNVRWATAKEQANNRRRPRVSVRRANRAPRRKSLPVSIFNFVQVRKAA